MILTTINTTSYFFIKGDFLIKQIKKRNGSIVLFQPDKIEEAIWKAVKSVGGTDREKVKEIAKKVVLLVDDKFKDTIPSVEDIQDAVEKILIEEGHAKTAKAYILYRKTHQEIREATHMFDSIKAVDDYISVSDWLVNENSNMGFSLQGLNNYLSTKIISHYWLKRIYPEAVRKAHEEVDLHIHDLGTLGAYCVGWDLQDLLKTGFKGVSGKVASKPAKHFRTALGQMVNFFYTLQGESAGAQAFANVDTLLAPFIKYDNIDYKEVKQALQEFLFNLSVPTRVGFQSPFTNITLDLKVPDMLKKEKVIIGGVEQKETYGDFQKEVTIFNKAFAEIMCQGDAEGRVFTFPIPTYNITKDFDWDNEDYNLIWEMTGKYGIPYFSNFVNSDMSPDDARSMCCRLRIDKRELKRRGGGLFGANPLTGCYDDKTEILTENGWKFFKDLTKDENVFTLRSDNKIELNKPTKLFKYNYEGEMFHFKAKSLDLFVTPNHRMVIDQVESKKRKFVEAQFFNVDSHRIPKKSEWDKEDIEWFILPSIEFTKYGRQGRTPYQTFRDQIKIKMDTWLKFFGIWVAEGYTDNEKIAKRHGYRVGISQVDSKKRSEIKEVLDELPFNYRTEDTNFIICNKQLWKYLRQFGNKYQKHIPLEIKSLSKRQLSILFNWLVKGDGHVRKKTGQINYWTASKKLADDIQEIILKLGCLGTISIQKGKISKIGKRLIKSSTIYVIGLQKSNHYRLRKHNITKKQYKGLVFCCEVKNNTVFVRRNGRVSWCGNSLGVVTLNMSRIGFISVDENEFFLNLSNLMELAKESLEIKRKAIESFTEIGLYPYSKFYLRNIKESYGKYWKNHFSTIGILGMNEAIVNFMSGENIATPVGNKFAIKVLDFMRSKLGDFQEETGNLYNLEATPGESTTHRFALADKKRFVRIKVANDEDVRNGAKPFYTNSTHLPVNYSDDLFEVLELQDQLQVKYTGGTVIHGFVGERLEANMVKELVRKITSNFHLPYFTLTPTFSVCPKHGYLSGDHEYCPRCDQEIGYKEVKNGENKM